MAGRRRGGREEFTRAAGAVPAACGRSQLKRQAQLIAVGERDLLVFHLRGLVRVLVDSWKTGSGRSYIYVYLEPFRTEIWQRREAGCVLQPRQK